MSLGRSLRELRHAKGMTLASLARQADSHVGNLSRIERDKNLLLEFARLMKDSPVAEHDQQPPPMNGTDREQ